MQLKVLFFIDRRQNKNNKKYGTIQRRKEDKQKKLIKTINKITGKRVSTELSITFAARFGTTPVDESYKIKKAMFYTCISMYSQRGIHGRIV